MCALQPFKLTGVRRPQAIDLCRLQCCQSVQLYAVDGVVPGEFRLKRGTLGSQGVRAGIGGVALRDRRIALGDGSAKFALQSLQPRRARGTM